MTADPILVSIHARDQAAHRYPDFYRERGVAGIVADVGAALREGRKAKTKPRWATIADRQRRRQGGTIRFVWNEAKTRCYVVVRGPTKRGPGWIVATVLRPTEERAA